MAKPGEAPGVRTVVRRASVGLACVLLTIVVSALCVNVVLQRTQDSRRDTLALLRVAETYRADVLAAESSLGGWVVVRRPEFLEPYLASGIALAESESRMVRGTSGDERVLVDRAIGMRREWRQEFAEPIRLALGAGEERRARDMLESGAGKQRIDATRAALWELDQSSEQRLDTLERSVGRTTRGGLAVMGVLTLVAVLTLRRLSSRVRSSVSEPLVRLTGAARRFGTGDLEVRAEQISGREVREVQDLTHSFDAMAEQLATTINRLHEGDELKSRFVSTVSHELRTPLTSVRGYLEALIEGDAGPLNDEQADYAAVAYRNAGRLESLIEDVLLLSRIESGRLSLNRRLVDLSELIVEQQADLAPRAASKGLSLEVDVVEGIVVEGDPARLRQVVSNLLTNAIKFTTEGGRVTVQLTDGGSRARLLVADTGVGIPVDELSEVGARFFRASTANLTEGTGLGLTITNELVELHGGVLLLASEEGVGTTVSVSLPVAAPALAATSAPKASST